MFKFYEIKNIAEYNLLSVEESVPFTQAWFFGKWQEIMERKVRRFEIIKDSETIGFFQVIKYPSVFSKSFLYIPHGPVLIKKPDMEFLKIFSEKLIQISKEENAIFVRFDFHGFNYGSKENLGRYFKRTPAYAYHSSYFQPKFEWILNLANTEEEILNYMHPKSRYNINLATRKGVKIEIINEDFKKYFDDFYKLLNETARRDNFNLHHKIYYQNIFTNCAENRNAFLAIAKYNGNILAINIILLFGSAAYFILGGSSGEHKNFMFSYLAQWEAMKEAKKRGFKIYNFGAVDREGFEGISRFKKGFGGELLKHSDSYDLVLKPFWYYLYNLRKWLLNQK